MNCLRSKGRATLHTHEWPGCLVAFLANIGYIGVLNDAQLDRDVPKTRSLVASAPRVVGFLDKYLPLDTWTRCGCRAWAD
jgi:hypothetical protein